MRLHRTLMLSLSIAALLACDRQEETERPVAVPEAAPPAEEMPVQEPAPDEMAAADPLVHHKWTLSDDAARVDARANIYLAGQAEAPAADPGQGMLPVAINLATATTIQFPVIEGLLGCAGGEPVDGPDGGQCVSPSTDITAKNGYSGSKSSNRSLFLVGVFPVDPKPEVEVEAGVAPETDSEARIAPKANQVFVIGDGKTADGQLQSFVKPEGATTLYLGFADAGGFYGEPGAYEDNVGYLRYTYSLDPK
ncbi:MAG: hypothetical protein IPG63_15485 [Xanthomonadales bacterium]|jgi:hypothetical protein|nr:hypothetical protein [Xanthomonadales bacterium]MCC6559782.1 hypothetical protein [Xanthomonadales bacterium]